jgi:peroxin-16
MMIHPANTAFRSIVHGVTDRMRGKPLLDMVGSIIEDYQFLYDDHYFASATM